LKDKISKIRCFEKESQLNKPAKAVSFMKLPTDKTQAFENY